MVRDHERLHSPEHQWKHPRSMGENVTPYFLAKFSWVSLLNAESQYWAFPKGWFWCGSWKAQNHWCRGWDREMAPTCAELPSWQRSKAPVAVPQQSNVPVENEALKNTQVLEEAKTECEVTHWPKETCRVSHLQQNTECECDLGRLSLGPSPCTEMPKHHSSFHADLWGRQLIF